MIKFLVLVAATVVTVRVTDKVLDISGATVARGLDKISDKIDEIQARRAAKTATPA